MRGPGPKAANPCCRTTNKVGSLYVGLFSPRAATDPGSRLLAKGTRVIILGVILLIVGFLTHIGILWTIGIILVVIGLILYVLGMAGRAVGGRKHYY